MYFCVIFRIPDIMRRAIFVSTFLLSFFTQAHAQLFKNLSFQGVYLQWGYNRDWYSASDIHFSNGGVYDFTVHQAAAEDKPDFDGLINAPLQITIPQYNYRIGIYLNSKHTHAIEINFDHAKYVMKDYQRLKLTGQIDGEIIDKDTIIDPQFLHFEHTDGANFYHLNYVGQQTIFYNHKHTRALVSTVYKAGAGVVIPRTDVTYKGKELNNKFHVAGYILSIEAGIRFYPLKNFFFELTGKTGYANYLDALAIEGGVAKHHFYYAEMIGTIGYDINFHPKKKN